ncbi:carboxypeptidase N subunit 2-like [Bradysia coprophila]|uniref:carboxypeptidase N subunit 2-like n=1 Tax=Bradysia coprophila TaxID=38358 RepID=UPI00187DC6A6|nr:carboxypeptidase N subunit 2-like [Bradysia coprophila]
MNAKLFLIVILCFVSSTIGRRKHVPTPSEFSCPKSCDCDKLNYYKETKCSGNGSSLELILRQTSILPSPQFTHIRGNHLTVNCTTADHFAYEIVSEFNFVNLVFIRYNGCPLPLSKSFSQIHSGLYEFHFNTTESVSITREYFNGLGNLQELFLRSSSSMDLADDVVTDLPYLIDLTIISKEINEKIFDQPSNVTALNVGGLSGEFNTEVLKKWTQLTSFSLTESKIQHLSKKLFASVPNILTVSLKFNEITSIDSDAFESLEKLQGMSLVKNKFVNIPQRLIIKTDSFNYFRIECDEDTSLDTLPDEFLSSIPNLRTVYIIACNLKSVPENLLKNSTNVYDLNMRNNALTDLPENFLANQTKLGHINFSSNRFSQSSDQFFENLLTKPIWGSDRFNIYFMMNGFESLSRERISYLSQFRGYFDFRWNSITDLSGFDGLVKGNEDSFINVERNPINCECLSVNAYKKYAEVTAAYYQRHINDTVCASPLNLNGTAVINVDC